MTADESEIVDDINIGTAARLLNNTGPAPMACCPSDGEPIRAPTYGRISTGITTPSTLNATLSMSPPTERE